jgi:hypothetical protein
MAISREIAADRSLAGGNARATSWKYRLRSTPEVIDEFRLTELYTPGAALNESDATPR